MLLAISSSSPAQSMSSCRSPRRRSGGSGFNGPRCGMRRTIELTSRLVTSPSLEVVAAAADGAVRRQPAEPLVQGVQRAVPGTVPEDLAGPVDACRDAAGGVV